LNDNKNEYNNKNNKENLNNNFKYDILDFAIEKLIAEFGNLIRIYSYFNILILILF